MALKHGNSVLKVVKNIGTFLDGDMADKRRETGVASWIDSSNAEVNSVPGLPTTEIVTTNAFQFSQPTKTSMATQLAPICPPIFDLGGEQNSGLPGRESSTVPDASVQQRASTNLIQPVNAAIIPTPEHPSTAGNKDIIPVNTPSQYNAEAPSTSKESSLSTDDMEKFCQLVEKTRISRNLNQKQLVCILCESYLFIFYLFIYFTQLVVHDQLARKVRERGDSQPRQEKKRKEYRKREERRIDKNPAMRSYRTTLCDRSAFLKLERHFDVLTCWGSRSQRL